MPCGRIRKVVFELLYYESEIDGSKVLAFRGTANKAGWANNFQQGLGYESVQCELAMDLAKDTKRLYHAVDNTKKTPVMYAANLNQYEIVYYLLNKGADHKHLSRGGVSLAEIVQDSTVDPQFAAYEICQKVIKILEERGVRFPVPHPAENQDQGQ